MLLTKTVTENEFRKAIAQPHIEKRIMSHCKFQDIYYTCCGKEVASHHRTFTRKNSNKIAHETFTITE